MKLQGEQERSDRRLQWPKQERMGRGRGYLEAKAQDFWTFWQRRPMDRRWNALQQCPSANTGNTESKMVWLQSAGCAPAQLENISTPHPLMPQLRNGQRRIRLRRI